MNTKEELAQYFVHHVTKARVGVDKRVEVAIQSINDLIKKGWHLYEIKIEIDQFAKDYPQIVENVYHLEEIMGKKEPPNNLMEPEVFYYHNLLREVSPPTRIRKNKVTGELERITEPFYLEMKSRFTMQDLLDYWYGKANITPNEHMIRQDEGKFKYMLGIYTIDEILFSIDVSCVLRKEKKQRPIRNAFELERYMDEARDFIKAKENTHKLQGINREFKRNNNISYH